MTDKQIRQELAVIHGKLYSLMQAIAVLIAEAKDGNYDEALKRMNDDSTTFANQLLNSIEAQDLADGEI